MSKNSPTFSDARPVAASSFGGEEGGFARFDHPEVNRARVFAVAAHAAVGQVRKYTLVPYWTHPMEVAALVATVPHTPAMLAAALLHDVVEDTHVTLDLLTSEFGIEVAEMVAGLTDVSRPEDGNRTARKSIDRDHSAQTSPAVKTIKLADLISNSRSILVHDPKFAKVYLHEKARLLEVLKAGDPVLWALANSILEGAIRDGVLLSEDQR